MGIITIKSQVTVWKVTEHIPITSTVPVIILTSKIPFIDMQTIADNLSPLIRSDWCLASFIVTMLTQQVSVINTMQFYL